MKKNIWLEGMMGLVVGDALGNPVQFMEREEIRNRKRGPVVGMEAGGAFRTPIGTWTDDSSMAIATLVSIIESETLDADDVMHRFEKWLGKGEYTPFGYAFDVGLTCASAIKNYAYSKDVNTCGITGEHANGNGALMRIMPACLYLYEKKAAGEIDIKCVVDKIHQISGLTHNHLRSKMCCVMYYFMIESIIDGYKDESRMTLKELMQRGIDKAVKFYGDDISNLDELSYLKRMFYLDEFAKTNEDEILSSGYVLHSIEAAVWCLINTASLEECLLKVVNLGKDTDSIAAIAGGLATLYYGYDAIPKNWLDVIQRREWIIQLVEKAENMTYK